MSNKILNAPSRGGSRTAATAKMERFVMIVNDWKPLTIITKRSILHVAAVLDTLLACAKFKRKTFLSMALVQHLT